MTSSGKTSLPVSASKVRYFIYGLGQKCNAAKVELHGNAGLGCSNRECHRGQTGCSRIHGYVETTASFIEVIRNFDNDCYVYEAAPHDHRAVWSR